MSFDCGRHFFQGHPYIWRTTVHHDIFEADKAPFKVHPVIFVRVSEVDKGEIIEANIEYVHFCKKMFSLSTGL